MQVIHSIGDASVDATLTVRMTCDPPCNFAGECDSRCVLIRRSRRYRLYPTPEQTARVSGWEHALRWLWNLMHAERVAKLEFDRKQPTAFDQINSLTRFRAALPWLAEVPRNVCAQMLVELDKAWQRGFGKLAKMPRFKRKNRGDHAPLIEPHPKTFRVEGEGRHGVVVFPKLGTVRAVVHDPLPGKAKTCAIVREGDEWYAAVSCEFEISEPPPSDKPAVAIDRGVAMLIADSDGRIVKNLRPMEALRRKVAKAQRRAVVAGFGHEWLDLTRLVGGFGRSRAASVARFWICA